jgi:hypothetical protein
MLHYDPQTGLFTRVATVNGRSPWFIGRIVGVANSRGYLQARVYGRSYLLSRLAWLYMMGRHPEGEIDHIDRNPKNNTWVNLRDVPRSVNMKNRRTLIGKTSAFRGVSRRGSKWQVVVRIEGRLTFLGQYADEAEAGRIAAPYFAGIAP